MPTARSCFSPEVSPAPCRPSARPGRGSPAALITRCNNWLGHNGELGRAPGLTQEHLDLLAGDGWKDSGLFSPKEKAAIRWAEEVSHLRAKGNDVAFAEMQGHFTTRQIVELTFLCGMWNLSGGVAEALHLVVEPPGRRIALPSPPPSP